MAVLFVITCTIIFAFVPEPVPALFDPGFEQSHIPETSELNDLPDLPAGRPAKIRRKLTYFTPPRKAVQQISVAEPEPIRSILVPRAFSYAVIQQPGDEPYYVSSARNLVTEFALAREHNNIGLLAHNNLAGSSFKYLEIGQEIYIVRTDGHTDRFTVSAIHRFQALESNKTESRFVDLETGMLLTAAEVFAEMYMGAPHLTLQTCIDAKGDASWGRLFVIATPVREAD